MHGFSRKWVELGMKIVRRSPVTAIDRNGGGDFV
jgi:hypothetical protein